METQPNAPRPFQAPGHLSDFPSSTPTLCLTLRPEFACFLSPPRAAHFAIFASAHSQYLRAERDTRPVPMNSYNHLQLPELPLTMTGGDRGGENGVCLLSLDGGGVRGLSSLYILRRIMVKMNAERQQRGEPDAKPCHVFDLIGGTSTGGQVYQGPQTRNGTLNLTSCSSLIAILLGRLEMSVDECLAVFKDCMSEIFKRRKHSTKFNLLNGELQHGFSPDNLKKAIEKALASKNIPTDALYDNGQERTCRTWVTFCSIIFMSSALLRLDALGSSWREGSKATVMS